METVAPAPRRARASRTDAQRRRVHSDVVLPLRADVAQDRLRLALPAVASTAAPGLTELSLVVGPARRLPLRKRVRAQLHDPFDAAGTYVLPLRWAPSGPAARCYPTLAGKVGVTPIDTTSCLLSFVAQYTPPLGRVGAVLDRAAMSRVAGATARLLTERLAAAVSAVDTSRRPKEGRP